MKPAKALVKASAIQEKLATKRTTSAHSSRDPTDLDHLVHFIGAIGGQGEARRRTRRVAPAKAEHGSAADVLRRSALWNRAGSASAWRAALRGASQAEESGAQAPSQGRSRVTAGSGDLRIAQGVHR